jgi:hypothetical protein
MASSRLRLAIILTLLILVSTFYETSAANATLTVRRHLTSCTAYTEHDKGIFVETDLLTGGLSPSFTDLRQANFTLVGTYVKSGSASEWRTISTWITAAKAAGLRTLVQAGPLPQPTIQTALDVTIASTKKAASIGADVIELDEFLSATMSWSEQFTQSQLQSIIEAGLAVNPKLQFIVTEWSSDPMKTAFSWMSSYQCVRVANDNYNNKGLIDLDVQLSSQYGKAPLTWLIFSKGSSNFDCYLNLNDWITYTKQANVDALFYWIDPTGTWQTQWSTVTTF